MDKKISLKMDSSKNILILVNTDEKYIIQAKERTITAAKIYEILDFSYGDKYTLTAENENNYDEEVLKFFKEKLFSPIVDEINKLSDNDGEPLI